MTSRQTGLAVKVLIAVILAGGFLLRVFHGPLLGLPERGPGRGFVVDEQEYYSAAAMFADGRGFSFYDTFTWTRAPLYVAFVGSVFRLAGKNLQLIFALQAAMSMATVFLLARLAGRIAARGAVLSRQAAELITLVLGSVWLSFTLFSELLLSETLFLLLFVGGLSLLARYFEQKFSAPVRSSTLLPVLFAGLLFGLAALTRSTALAFVPLAALALFVYSRTQAGKNRNNIPDAPTNSRLRLTLGLIPALVLLVGAGIVVGPWTLRNYAAYHSLVLIDTSAGYNLWLASVGVRDESRLAGDLKNIAGPVAKQNFAFSQAFTNIAADPLAFIGKGLSESADLWAINPTAEERLDGGFSQGRVSAAHLLSLFTFEDVLYIAIVALALAGMLASPPDPLKWLIVLWALLWVAMAFVFFAVNRFRFPLVASLLPWVPIGGAYTVGSIRALLQRRAVKPLALLSNVAAPLIVFALLAPMLPFGFTQLGVSRWFSQEPYRAAEQLLVAGQFAAAKSTYAQANQEMADTKFGIDSTDMILTNTASDTNALSNIASRPELAADLSAPGYSRYEPFLLGGSLALLTGDTKAAKTLLGARPVDDQTLLALDWLHAHFAAPAPAQVDIGSDLDVPYITGLYTSEGYAAGDYRWSAASATIKLGGAASQHPTIRWSGWRPQGVAAAHVTVDWRSCGLVPAALEQTCPWNSGAAFDLPTGDTWQEDTLQVPANAEIRFEVNGFVAGGFDPRELGVRIDWVHSQ